MSSYSHGHIIPLVGGSVVGTTNALGRDPEWIASWSDTFGLNDSYCLKFFSEIPFFNLDENAYPKKYVDIITSLPPCAGLSMANTTSGDTANNPRGCQAPSNMHMVHASEYAMNTIKPKAIMVENAPTLFSKMGEEFAERINGLAQKHDYTMSLVKTSTIKHGVPQERTRSFFFLWRGKKVPVLRPINKSYKPFHQFIKEGEFAPSPFVNTKGTKPSDDPLWQFIREKYRGSTTQDILSIVAAKKMVSVWEVIYNSGWLDEACVAVRDERMNRWLNYTRDKKADGKNIMDGSMKLAWHRTQSLMWKTLPMLMHPHEDRWLNTSEALGMMGFPYEFNKKVQVDSKNSNVICQNVPACTAGDWIGEVAEALDGNREWIEPGLKDDKTPKILRQSNVVSKKTMEPIWNV